MNFPPELVARFEARASAFLATDRTRAFACATLRHGFRVFRAEKHTDGKEVTPNQGNKWRIGERVKAVVAGLVLSADKTLAATSSAGNAFPTPAH
jgi:hypothetical protein